MFANGPEDRGSIAGRVIPKTQKMILDATLLNVLSGEHPGACSGLRSGAWLCKRNNVRLEVFRLLVSTRLPSGRRAAVLFLCNPCMVLDLASSLSRKLAYVPGPTLGFVKLLASSGSHCTKWADEQHIPAGFESRLIPDPPSLLAPL